MLHKPYFAHDMSHKIDKMALMIELTRPILGLHNYLRICCKLHR